MLYFLEYALGQGGLDEKVSTKARPRAISARRAHSFNHGLSLSRPCAVTLAASSAARVKGPPHHEPGNRKAETRLGVLPFDGFDAIPSFLGQPIHAIPRFADSLK
jgi:hypothetical protein